MCIFCAWNANSNLVVSKSFKQSFVCSLFIHYSFVCLFIQKFFDTIVRSCTQAFILLFIRSFESFVQSPLLFSAFHLSSLFTVFKALIMLPQGCKFEKVHKLFLLISIDSMRSDSPKLCSYLLRLFFMKWNGKCILCTVYSSLFHDVELPNNQTSPTTNRND